MTKAQSLGGAQVRSGAVPRNVPQAIDVTRASAEPLRQGSLTMPGAEQQASDRDPVERAIAPVTAPVTQAQETVAGAVGEMVVPEGRGVTSAGSLVERAVPAAQASGEMLTAAQQPVADVLTPTDDGVAPLEGAQPAMTMLSALPAG